jgi:hypothetical protein
MAQEPSPRAGPTWWGAGRVFLFLLLGLVALDAAVVWNRPLWQAYDPDDYAARLDVCRGRQYDLVAVGGSPVAEGLDTRLLIGLRRNGRPVERVYNLGLIGGTTSEVWHGVANGVTVPPRVLVYGITASDLNDGRDEPHGARSLMTLGDVVRMAWRRPRRLDWFARHWAAEHAGRLWQLWHRRTAVRLWAAHQFDRAWPGAFPEAVEEARQGLARAERLAQDHGYAPDPAIQARDFSKVRPAGRAKLIFPYLTEYRLGEHLGYLHRLINWGRDNGVEVILVDVPITAELERRFPAEYATYREVLAVTAKERGVRVIWASRDAVGLGDADFGDLIHLNARGAEKFSRWLRHQLESGPGAPAGGTRPGEDAEGRP